MLKSVGSGALVFLVAQGAWIFLLGHLLAHPTARPWELPAMAAFLLGGIAYLHWGAWPVRGRTFRRNGLRFNAVPLRTILFALLAGWATMFAGFVGYAAHRALHGLGGESPLALPHGGGSAFFAGLVMAGVVAGTIEEIAFRGFMQGPLEKRFGLLSAIFVTGLCFALVHTNHSYFGEEAPIWVAIFLCVSAILGVIASRTNSVIPGIVVHAGFDSAYFVAAGLLQPRIAPLAFVQSLASPSVLLFISAASAVCAVAGWVLFFNATAKARHEERG
jgi:membrane protease YdiL (CAAX protease family)